MTDANAAAAERWWEDVEADPILWPEEDMIAATLETWAEDGEDADDYAAGCEVIESTDDEGRRCLVVLHRPSGRTSDEFGNAGQWRLDGRDNDDRWTRQDVIEAAAEMMGHGGTRIVESEWEVIEGTDDEGRRCVVVLHRPSGTTSDEEGDRGRWRLDGRRYGR